MMMMMMMNDQQNGDKWETSKKNPFLVCHLGYFRCQCVTCKYTNKLFIIIIVLARHVFQLK